MPGLFSGKFLLSLGIRTDKTDNENQVLGLFMDVSSL